MVKIATGQKRWHACQCDLKRASSCFWKNLDWFLLLEITFLTEALGPSKVAAAPNLTEVENDISFEFSVIIQFAV
jgi:hypothetical protein